MHITQFLSKARFRSSDFGIVVCHAPWGGAIPQMPRATIFLMREGACYLAAAEQEPVFLTAGDVVILPRCLPHRLCSSLDVIDTPVSEVVRKRPAGKYVISHGGDGARTVFCAALASWDDVAQATVARILPEVIVVRRQEFATDSEIQSLAAMLEREAYCGRDICPTTATHLLNLVLSEALFAKFGGADVRQSLMKGFARPPIARALMLLHSSLASDWTVTELAKRVGMSRSSFTMEFIATIGVSPGAYLTEMKLNRAAALLRTTSQDLAVVADIVGYSSVPSFIKAFKHRYGRPPGRYRAQEGAADSEDFSPAPAPRDLPAGSGPPLS